MVLKYLKQVLKALLDILSNLGIVIPFIILIIVCYSGGFWYLSTNLLIGCLLLSCTAIVSNKAYNKLICGIALIIYNIIILIQIFHYLIFNDNIKPSTVYIFLDSNSVEIIDFLSMYASLDKIVIIFICVIAVGIGVYQFAKKNSVNRKYVYLPITVLLLITLSVNPLRGNSIFFKAYDALKNYNENTTALSVMKTKPLGGEFTQVSKAKTSDPKIHVLILGESTTRNHMSLYGYYRNTTPKLNEIKDEIIVFKNGISPHTHTITSLAKMLTLASYEQPDKMYDGNIMQLYNKAGFETYWVSNQKPLGFHETTATAIASLASKTHFVNTSGYGIKSLDEKVLSPLQEIINDDKKSKFIVIHLMGTHVKYEHQYPDNFNLFKSRPETLFESEESFSQINHYDNAVAYNDYIIRTIIDKIRATNTESYVLYTSDHGEEVYETKNFAGHQESNGTAPMYHVPFILWRSEKFKLNNSNLKFTDSLKFSTENLIYSLSDLSNINFKEFENDKSIFNQHFKERPRYISDNITYEAFFKKN